MTFAYKKRSNVSISDHELALLELIHTLGPCSSQKVHELLDEKFLLLTVMRSLHALVEKGFLQRAIINKKQFYKTTRNFSNIKRYLKSENPEF